MNRSFQHDLMIAEVANELPPRLYFKVLGELLGLVSGDGSVAKNSVDFANTNIKLIKKFIKNFKIIFGNSYRFSYYLSVPKRHENEIEKITLFWKKRLKTSKILHYTSKKGRIKTGVLKICVYNMSLVRYVRDLLKLSFLRRMIGNEFFEVGFIRGFMAAEGTVLPEKNNPKIPHSIQLPSTNMKVLEIIKDYLTDLGIESRIVAKDRRSNYFCVIITRLGNFKKFYEKKLAHLHDDKKLKLYNGINSYKIDATKIKRTSLIILSALSKGPLTRKEIYKFIDKAEWEINTYLYSKKSHLLKKGLIRKVKKGNGIYWELTKAGGNFLKTPTFRGMKVDLPEVDFTLLHRGTNGKYNL